MVICIEQWCARIRLFVSRSTKEKLAAKNFDILILSLYINNYVIIDPR